MTDLDILRRLLREARSVVHSIPRDDGGSSYDHWAGRVAALEQALAEIYARDSKPADPVALQVGGGFSVFDPHITLDQQLERDHQRHRTPESDREEDR